MAGRQKQLDLWIPAGTPQGRRVGLRGAANLHDYPGSGPWPDHLGRGDMLVADHDVEAALEAMSRLEGLRVVQTLSAGVDRIVDRIPSGITLCDASGVTTSGSPNGSSWRSLPRIAGWAT